MKKKGFTLLEIIATMAILAISITGILAGFGSASKIYGKGNAKLNSSSIANSTISIMKSQNGQGVRKIYNIWNKDAVGTSITSFNCEDVTTLKEALNQCETQNTTTTKGRYIVKIEIIKPDDAVITDYEIYNFKVSVSNKGVNIATRVYDFTIPQ